LTSDDLFHKLFFKLNIKGIALDYKKAKFNKSFFLYVAFNQASSYVEYCTADSLLLRFHQSWALSSYASAA